MPGFGGIGPGFALLALAALAVWIVILVWLASWIILRLRNRYGWKLLDWRTILIPFVTLTGASTSWAIRSPRSIAKVSSP